MSLKVNYEPSQTRVVETRIRRFDAISPPQLKLEFEGDTKYQVAGAREKHEQKGVKAKRGMYVLRQVAADGKVTFFERFWLAWDVFFNPEVYISKQPAFNNDVAAEMNKEIDLYNHDLGGYCEVRKKTSDVTVTEGELVNPRTTLTGGLEQKTP